MRRARAWVERSPAGSRREGHVGHDRPSGVAEGRGLRLLSLVALAGVALAGSSVARAAEPFAFGLWGDMPYAKANDQPKIAPLIAAMNASDIAFSIFDGDIKDGGSKCTDDVFTDPTQMFDALRKPLVYRARRQ